ncbi:MAG: hypothetical protein LBV43_14135 [Prevotella sp.]|jgi:hypothetical protein|nr:hypothetical protein [Prevotella sp.]
MKKLSVVFLISIASLLIGCNNSLNEIVTKEDSNTTPFASQELLEVIATNDGFVHWKVARFFALNELDDRRSENSWFDAWLSEYPLVIYNDATGDPRYYEFRILKSGKEVGAISCAVDKGEGSPVQYVLPFVHEIESQNARSVLNNTTQFVDSGYPSRLEQKPYRARSIGTIAGTEGTDDYQVDTQALDILLNDSKEELERLGINIGEIKENYLNTQREKAAQLALFWQEVEELENKVINMTEKELQKAFNNYSSIARSTAITYSGTYLLNDWLNKSTWYDSGTYCGPNVIAFIILGLGTNSGYANVPISNDKKQLENFYKTIEGQMGQGPKGYHWFEGDSMNGWMNTFTGGTYKIVTNWGIPFIVNHDWESINASIRGNQLPVISLRLPKVETFSGGFHYRTIIGTRKATTTLTQKVLWWTVTVPLSSEGQYYMHDNGADGGINRNWWEAWSLLQFHAASVAKK